MPNNANGKATAVAEPETQAPEAVIEVAEMNIFQKLHLAWQKIRYAQKTGKVEGRRSKYNFVRYDEFATQVREAFIEARLVCFQEILESQIFEYTNPEGIPCHKVTVKIRVHVRNIDNPEESLYGDGIGTGENEWDKGSGIATTYAMKNALLKLTLVESGDEDPEYQEIQANNKHTRQPEPAVPQERTTEPDPAESEADQRKKLYDEIQGLMELHKLDKEKALEICKGKKASDMTLDELTQVPKDIRARYIKVDVQNDPQPLHESYAQITAFLEELGQTEVDLEDVLREHFKAKTLNDLTAPQCHRLALMLRTKVGAAKKK